MPAAAVGFPKPPEVLGAKQGERATVGYFGYHCDLWTTRKHNRIPYTLSETWNYKFLVAYNIADWNTRDPMSVPTSSYYQLLGWVPRSPSWMPSNWRNIREAHLSKVKKRRKPLSIIMMSGFSINISIVAGGYFSVAIEHHHYLHDWIISCQHWS